MKISLFFNKMILFILGIIIACVLYMNIKFIINTNTNIVLIAIPSFIIFGIMFVMYKYSFNFITLVFSIFIISFLLCFIISKNIKTEPISDFKVLYDASVSLSRGDTSFSETKYFTDWSYQIGFVIYQSVIIKMFGENTNTLILLNCIYMSAINTLVFLIATVITKNIKAGAFSAYVYMFYPAKYLYVTVLTNQHLSLLLFLLSIYFSLRFGFKKIRIIIISLILFIMANFIRPIGIIYVIALLLYLFYIYLSSNNIKIGLAKASRISIIVLILYFGINIIVSQVVKINVSKYGLKNNEPLWKFACGLNTNTFGTYSEELEQHFFSSSEKEKRNIISGFISDIIKNPIDFFYKKNINLYTPLEDTNWAFTNFEHKNKILDIVRQIDKFYYLIIWLLCFVSVILMLKYNCNKMIYINLILICFVLIHQIIEVQVRYRYCFMVYLFIIISVFQKYLKINSKKTSQ